MVEDSDMRNAFEWMRSGLAIAGLVALGYALGSTRQVKAASSAGDGVSFQMEGVSDNSALLVYHPDSKSLYVYRGATIGSSVVQCAYMFQIGQPGAPLKRSNCPVGSAQ
jgi:hypothetical protein